MLKHTKQINDKAEALEQQNLAPKHYRSWAPGSLMITGEHAVIYYGQAISVAVNLGLAVNLSVEASPDSRGELFIQSELGAYQGTLEFLHYDQEQFATWLQQTPQAKFRFILATLWSYQLNSQSRLSFKISSELSSELGLGSSAALVAACSKVCWQVQNANADYNANTNADVSPDTHATPDTHASSDAALKIFLTGKAAILLAQGRGSGADLAASCFGGYVYYKFDPQNPLAAQSTEIQLLPFIAQILPIYIGYKLPTVQVLKLLQQRAAECPNEQKRQNLLLQEMNALVSLTKQYWRQNNQAMTATLIGSLLRIYDYYLTALGVDNADFILLRHLINNHLPKKDLAINNQLVTNFDPPPYAYKISGSGLGDCLIIWLPINNTQNKPQLPVPATSQQLFTKNLASALLKFLPKAKILATTQALNNI